MPFKHIALLTAAGLIALSLGCAKKPQAPTSPEQLKPGAVPKAPQPQQPKVDITAYINVSSGCQEPTVKLVRDLAQEYQAAANVEIVDFGSPEGAKRWKSDGMTCMGILFDEGEGPSPVIKFPATNGKSKTVAFFMPAGFAWTHEDLKRAFEALQNGNLEILSRQEAMTAMEPKSVTLTTDLEETEQGARLLINEKPVITVRVEAAGKSPTDRAQHAKDVIDDWASQPAHPNHIKAPAKEGKVYVKAKEATIIEVTDEDAQAAGKEDPKKLATQWQEAIRKALVDAVRATEATEEDASPQA